MKTQLFEPLCGTSIENACIDALVIAKKDDCTVEFYFNGIKMEATPSNDVKELTDEYWSKSKAKTEEYLNSDEYKQQQEEYRKSQEEKENLCKDMLARHNTPILFANKEAWDKTVEANRDCSYGSAIMAYAERWMKLMEIIISEKGDITPDEIDKMSHVANLEGVTGFMHSCAKSIIHQTWTYGDKLQ